MVREKHDHKLLQVIRGRKLYALKLTYGICICACAREREREESSRIGGNGGGGDEYEYVWSVMTCNPIMARCSKGE